MSASRGAAGAQLEVFLVWLDKSKMFVPTPPLPDCLPLPLCVRRASAHAAWFHILLDGRKNKAGLLCGFVSRTQNTEGRITVTVSADLLTLPWKVFTKTQFKHSKCILFDKNTKYVDIIFKQLNTLLLKRPSVFPNIFQ